MKIKRFNETVTPDDPYGEEDWNDDWNLYVVAIGRDFDVVGYVAARDADEAKQLGLDKGLYDQDLVRYVRVAKIEKGDQRRYLDKENKKYEETKKLKDSILSAIAELSRK
jgi:hypothetical protein